MPNLHKWVYWALPDKGSAARLDVLLYFAEAAGGLVDFPFFAEATGLVDLLYFVEAAEHLHLELVGY
jgi:hypothetical protein